MSRTLSANFSTQNNLSEKDPVVRITFSGITRGYASGNYSSISANDRKNIINANVNLQKFDLLTAPFAIIGDTIFEILDKDDDLTSVLNSNNLQGVNIKTSLGFEEIVSGDFLDLPLTNIKTIGFNEDNLSFRFISKDARRLLKQKLYTAPASSQINDGTGISATDTTITLDSTTGFVDPANTPSYMEDISNTAQGFVIIGSELISYTGISSNDLTGCSRGVRKTDAASHADNEAVSHVIFWIHNSPHEVLLNVLMGTNDQTGHAYYDLSKFDVGYGDIGNIGLTASEVDIEGIQQIFFKLQDDNIPYDNVALHKEVSIITFIEEVILKPLGLFMFLDNSGKLIINSFDRLHIEESFSSAGTLNDGEILSISVDSREDLLINTISILPPMYTNGRRIDGVSRGDMELDASVSAYGATEVPFVIDGTPFRDVTTVATQKLLHRWFGFFSNIPATLKIKAKQKNINLEPGDFIQISRTSLPNLRNGTKGWTNVRALITGQKIGLSGAIEFDAISWDLYTRITNTISLTPITVSGRTAVTFSATNSSTLEAADGFHDFSASVDFVICTITIAKPNESPSGSNETIGLGFHIQNPTGTDVFTFNRRYIQYFTEDSDTITYKFILIVTASLFPSTVARVKVDWYERSTATAGKQPTITFTTIQHGTFPNTISTV